MVSIDLFKHVQDTINYEAGETIFEQGAYGDIMYAVVEGEVDIQINGVSFEVVGPGGIVPLAPGRSRSRRQSHGRGHGLHGS